MHFLAGDLDAIKLVAEEGIALADAIGDHFSSRQCRWNLVEMHIYRGHLDTAIEMIRDFTAEADAAHDALSKMIGLMLLAYALAFHGDTDEARAAANGSLEASAQLDGLFDRPAHATLAVACMADGDAAATWEAVQASNRHVGSNPAADMMNKTYLGLAAIRLVRRTAHSAPLRR